AEQTGTHPEKKDKCVISNTKVILNRRLCLTFRIFVASIIP
ncbi:hypothetical protein BACCELL_03239, partial [Bacteroides cellulosilyticus DSM 14838]